MAKKASKKKDKEIEIKLDEQEVKLENEEIEVIDFINNLVNLEAKGDFNAPRGFVPLKAITNIGEYGCINGRMYIVTAKNVAMWCDNGKLFDLDKMIEEMR